MAGTIRKFFESLLFVSVDPWEDPGGPRRGRLRRFWDWLVNPGPVPSDPLYVSNRGRKQEIRLVVILATPVLLVVAAAAYMMLTPPPRKDKAPAQLSTAEMAARTQILPKDFSI